MMFPEGGAPIDMRLLSGPIEALARPVEVLPAATPDALSPAETPSAVRTRPRKKSPTSEYLRSAELLEIVPFSRATLWRMVQAEKFPAPVKVSPRITAWKRSEVEAWVAAQVAPDGRWRRSGKANSPR